MKNSLNLLRQMYVKVCDFRLFSNLYGWVGYQQMKSHLVINGLPAIFNKLTGPTDNFFAGMRLLKIYNNK